MMAGHEGLGARIYIRLAFAIGAAAVVIEAFYLATSPLPFDPAGYLVGRDFVNMWAGAQLARTGDPSVWFDHVAYNSILQTMIRPGFPEHAWSYPPHMLLFTWPLFWLPYVPAYVLWCVLGLVAYLAASGEKRPERLLLLAVAPAVVVNILSGQNGLFLAALMIGGLTNLDRRPVLAGVLFGIMTLKPQLGLLIPLLLLVTWRWRVILSATVTFAALAALTALIFGPDIWMKYFEIVVPTETAWMNYGLGMFMMLIPTVFMNARAMGFPLETAYLAQAVVAAGAIAAVIWAFRRPRDPGLSNALFVTASLLVSYHSGLYDLAVFGWVLGLLLDRPDNRPSDYVLMLAVWSLPMTTFLLGIVFVPTSLVLIAFAVRLVWRLSEGTEPAVRAAGPGLAPGFPAMQGPDRLRRILAYIPPAILGMTVALILLLRPDLFSRAREVLPPPANVVGVERQP